MKHRPLLLVLVLPACNSILGIGEPPIEQMGSSPRAPIDGSTATVGDRDAATMDAGDAAVTGIDCLGTRRDVFFCDGFESAALSPTWQQVLVPATHAKLLPEPGIAVAGAQGLRAGFSPIPESGEAGLLFERPGGAGPISLQVSFYLDNDAWGPNQPAPLFGLRAGIDLTAVVTFISSGVGGGGSMELRVLGGPTIPIGPASVNAWVCYEVVYNGTNVTIYQGMTSKGSAPVTTAIDSAEIGMGWPLGNGPNDNAAKVVHYDDVVISPGRIGCLH
jgi:hypothetical protein